VPPSVQVRKQQFAAWVRRVTDHAKETRGLSIPAIAAKTDGGVSNQSIYRWLKADPADGPPLPDQIEAFCDATDQDPAVPFGILWPGRGRALPKVAPLPDTDLEELGRRLQHPRTSRAEKTVIRETIRFLLSKRGADDTEDAEAASGA
jgi:hypothetical protein